MHYALLFLFLPSCTQTDQDNPNNDPDTPSGAETTVRITLAARSNNQTRALEGYPPSCGDAEDPTESVELIHDWWIAFINENTWEVKILTRDEAKDKTTSTSVSIDGDGFEAETFRTTLPLGKYRIYAFANIPEMSKDKFEGLLKKETHKLDKKYFSHFVETEFGKEIMLWPSNVNIPMTAVMEREIKNTVEEAFTIEVVRGVAKVEFAFSNPSTDGITLQELKLSPITSSEEISIVPNYDAVGNSDSDAKNANDKLLNKTTDILTFSDMNIDLDPSGGTYTHEFYCKESLGACYDKDGKVLDNTEANKNSIVKENVFKIELTVTRTKAGETTGTPISKTFYTSKIQYINRNDWIKIPITFNNWVIKWNLHTYPPIGGYPPVFNQNGSGETLQATMTTGGEFELYPEAITQNGKAYTVDWSKTVNVTYEDPQSLFLVAPSLKENKNNQLSPVNSDKVIAGELDPKKEGDAKIRINFYLKNNEGNEITEEFTCLFTIHRQNSSPPSR